MTLPQPPAPGDDYGQPTGYPDAGLAVPPPDGTPAPKHQRPRRPISWRDGALGAVAGAVIVGAAWGISAGLGHASMEQEHAAALQPYREAAATLSALPQTCDLGSDAVVDERSVTFSNAGKYSDLSLTGVHCVLDALGAHSSTASKIGQTRALDGRQEDSWGVYTASWTYHPDDGLNLVVEIDDPPAS